MVDTVRLKVFLPKGLSEVDVQSLGLPYLIGLKVNEKGESTHRFLEEETIVSPLTGAKCKVRAVAKAERPLEDLEGYEMSINVPACFIGRNQLLVNGVPRAAEAVVELLRFHAAGRKCSTVGLEQLKLENCKLTSVTPCFLFVCDTPEEAHAKQQELRQYAEAIFNYTQMDKPAKKRSGKKRCFSVGPDDGYTLYIKLRVCSLASYIKEPDVPGAFAKYPSEEVKEWLESIALRVLRVEVTVHGKWLVDNGLESPEAWRNNPDAYEKVFNLAREALRLDENLRCRAPSESVIAKLPADHQTILIAHLDGENVRFHPLVLSCTGSGKALVDAQNKKFSAFKCPILEETGIDLTIPWEIQNTKLSPSLRDWFRFPGEFAPDDEIAEFVFSRTSALPTIETLKAKTDALIKRRSMD